MGNPPGWDVRDPGLLPRAGAGQPSRGRGSSALALTLESSRERRTTRARAGCDRLRAVGSVPAVLAAAGAERGGRDPRAPRRLVDGDDGPARRRVPPSGPAP